VQIFQRSRKQKDTLSYDRFLKGTAPAGFLPELSAINTSQYSGAKGPPIAIHIHHKFIVIDGDTDNPTIYSGSPNFSNASEHKNDENVLEIKNNKDVAHIYVAEFMRLFNHYRARALWNSQHKTTAPLVLADTAAGWTKDTYKAGTKAALARSRFL
jgi:phosphatidylserine/phosphatidylglycerophosphate/cardiolipin synthase-like enzyme